MEIVIDIETIPAYSEFDEAKIREEVRPPANYTKPETIEKWMAENREAKVQAELHALGLKAETGKIVCLSAVCEEGAKTFTGPEADILRRFVSWVELMAEIELPMTSMQSDIFLIAHNAEFDIPWIRRRMWTNRIRRPQWFPSPNAVSGRDYGCTMTRWAGRGGRISLENLCRALEVTLPDLGMDGSKVWDEYKAGRIEAIAEYCLADAYATFRVWELMR